VERVIRDVEGGALRFEGANGRTERSVCVTRLYDERTERVGVADMKADVCFRFFFHASSIAFLLRVSTFGAFDSKVVAVRPPLIARRLWFLIPRKTG